MTKYNVGESVKAQKEYCEKTGKPHFAPRSGECWKCKKNIYSAHDKPFAKSNGDVQIIVTGITTEEAAEKLVTGCPHCNRSYCD